MVRFFSVLIVIPFLLSISCNDERSQVVNDYQFDTLLITEASNLLGIHFDSAATEMMSRNLTGNLRSYEQMRRFDLDNEIAPAILFNPVVNGIREPLFDSPEWNIAVGTERPLNDEDIAFMKVTELASLIKERKITSKELTRIYIDRLKKYDDTLHCVVVLTEKLAFEQAERADRELEEGIYRGMLHGIPYGVKDLFAVPGYTTTWGATPYQHQIREETATVVRKLEDAGAVLVAKLSLGSLAMGDLWFAGRTRNPWNLEQGSSGSSAGSAAAVAAGLVGFAIGTETLGSIVSPSTRCGASGLRPTFGRVSRYGAMALSWTMDKAGPIARSAEDCALVLEYIRGSDGLDRTVIDFPFNSRTAADIGEMKIGYVKSYFDSRYETSDFDQEVLETLRESGARLIPVEFDFSDIPVNALRIILNAEAAAAFDELTRSRQDTLLTGQNRGDWPNIFRSARFVPAVEYIQANRFRTILMERMDEIMKEYDVIVTPSYGGVQLLVTNLTGHPCVVIPSGFRENGTPASISFIGNLFDEASPLAVAAAFQRATDYNDRRPPLFIE